MNSYILSRQWFDFSFENGSRVKPIHGSIYFWLIELANRLGWPAEFGSPGSQCMAACGISSYNTYKKAFDELAEFGFVEVKRKSVNQYSSCIIALSIIDNPQYKALDKALAEHSTKHLQGTVQSTVQSTDNINKPLTNKPTTPPTTPAGVVTPNKYDAFLKTFNELTKRSFKTLDPKAKTQFDKLKKAGYHYTDFLTAINNGFEDSHTWPKPQLFTPEYITREANFSKYLNWKAIAAAPEQREPKAFNSVEEHYDYWTGASTSKPSAA